MKVKKLDSRGCNVYFLEKDGEGFLVDTGTPLSAKLIESQVDRVEAILITHAHFDHIGSAAYLQKKYGCEIFVHKDDMPYLLGEKKFRYSGILGKFAEIGERLFRVKHPRDAKPVEEVFELGLKEAEVIHTPGHTPGSICIKVGNKLMCGDLFRGKSGKASLSPRAFCSDYSAYLESVRRVAALNFSRAFPGHGAPIQKREIDELVEKLEK